MPHKIYLRLRVGAKPPIPRVHFARPPGVEAAVCAELPKDLRREDDSREIHHQVLGAVATRAVDRLSRYVRTTAASAQPEPVGRVVDNVIVAARRFHAATGIHVADLSLLGTSVMKLSAIRLRSCSRHLSRVAAGSLIMCVLSGIRSYVCSGRSSRRRYGCRRGQRRPRIRKMRGIVRRLTGAFDRRPTKRSVPPLFGHEQPDSG